METIEQIEKRKAYHKEYYLKNAEKFKEYYLKNAEKIKAYSKELRLQNPEKIKAYMKEYRLQKAEEIGAWQKEYNLKNAEKIKAYQRAYQKEYDLQSAEEIKAYQKAYQKAYLKQYAKKRRQRDPNFRLIGNIRARITSYCRNIQIEKNFRTINALGCTAQEFKEHLERLFQMGMTWENYGLGGWVVDHIKPISLAKTSDEVYLLNHYTNLQPMWERDNLVKSNKYDEPTLQFHEPNEIDGFGEFLEEMLMLNQES